MRRSTTLCIFAALCWVPSFEIANADDWPMYRHDSGRRAVTNDRVPTEMRLAWTRKLPKLTPAFNHSRLQFDAGYEPIVASGHLLIASSQTDSVKAYATDSGEQLWSFYTNGPVRFAPVVWQGLVCFGSDDGYFYCVELLTGKLRWKHQAVPSQRRLLGNRRLISVWPIRGGAVVADGQVYFAAGVWPFEGVFVYAMDIVSGEVVWRNDRMGYLFGQQPHNTQAIGGLAPQGYLVIDGDELIVPCSTAYPAKLNRHTGELIEFELPAAGRYPGGWFAALDPDQARALRRGKLSFDEAINQQQHEDKIHKGRGGIEGLSREIRAGDQTIKFDEEIQGVDGEIHSMVVADDSLFVSMRDGRILCFDDANGAVGTAESMLKSPASPLVISNDAVATATAVLDAAEQKHGIAMVVGLSDGALSKALVQRSNYHVVIFEDDAEKVQRLRHDFDVAGLYGNRVAVVEDELQGLALPRYITSLLISERSGFDLEPLLQTLRPFGGTAVGANLTQAKLRTLQPGNFAQVTNNLAGRFVVRRPGPLPGTAQYSGDWGASKDELVRFPLGVLWFDDTLAHFKRSPQPRFDAGTMISRPKDWRAPRQKGEYKTDYPLLPPVLSDIYTGRVLEDSERSDLRRKLKATSPSIAEPSQYRPPSQKDHWKPKQPIAGERRNPLTGETEPRAFPKTYGCDGGIDYGDLYTLRSGTAAFYDKTAESGTVFLSGPRSGCTNSIIPSGGLLNVPYFYEGCTCSYPLPTAMSLLAMPESHEQWSSWGESEIKPASIQRLGVNFGAPGDRITRDGTLWLDYPSVGGPSPQVKIDATKTARFRYWHSVWMKKPEPYPWVSASMAEGLQRCVIQDLRPGKYLVRLFFNEPDVIGSGDRLQTVEIQGRVVLRDFDIFDEAGGKMRGLVKEFSAIEVEDELTVELSATVGKTAISGIELLRQE